MLRDARLEAGENHKISQAGGLPEISRGLSVSDTPREWTQFNCTPKGARTEYENIKSELFLDIARFCRPSGVGALIA